MSAALPRLIVSEPVGLAKSVWGIVEAVSRESLLPVVLSSASPLLRLLTQGPSDELLGASPRMATDGASKPTARVANQPEPRP